MGKFTLNNKFMQRETRTLVPPGGEIPESSRLLGGKKDAEYVYGFLQHKLWNQLGVDMKGLRQNGFEHLRVFEVTQDGRLKDPFVDDQGKELEVDAIVEKMQRGAFYVRPLGSKEPVQVQIEDGAPVFSKPHTPPAMENRRPERPNFFKRMLNTLTFGRAFRGDFKRYDDALAAHQANASKLDKANDALNSPEFDQNEQLRRDGEEQQRRRAEFERVRDGKEKTEIQSRIDAIEDYYGPKPVMRTALVDKQNGKGGNPVYTTEQFNQLKTYDIEGMKVGEQQIDGKQFAALATLAAISPEIGGTVRLEEGKVSPLENALEKSTMFVADLGMIQLPGGIHQPRASAGGYFDIMQQGREKAFQAIEAYQNGSKDEMAKLLADGINQQMGMNAHKPLTELATLSQDGITTYGAQLLEQDPALKTLAMQKYGLKPENLAAAKSMEKMMELADANERAEKMLNSGEHLNVEENRKCVDARLRYEFVNNSIVGYELAREKDPAYKKGIDELDKKYEQYMRDGEAEIYKKYNLSYEEGLKHEFTPEEQMDVILQKQQLAESAKPLTTKKDAYISMNMGIPPAHEKLGGENGMQVLEEQINKVLPGREKLYQVPSAKLSSELSAGKLFAEESPYRKAPEKQTQQKEIGQPQLNMNVELGMQ